MTGSRFSITLAADKQLNKADLFSNCFKCIRSLFLIMFFIYLVFVHTQIDAWLVLGVLWALSADGALCGALVTLLLEWGGAALGRNSHGDEGQDEDGKPREVHVGCRLQGNSHIYKKNMIIEVIQFV